MIFILVYTSGRIDNSIRAGIYLCWTCGSDYMIYLSLLFSSFFFFSPSLLSAGEEMYMPPPPFRFK